jgi:hypothetical protein
MGIKLQQHAMDRTRNARPVQCLAYNAQTRTGSLWMEPKGRFYDNCYGAVELFERIDPKVKIIEVYDHGQSAPTFAYVGHKDGWDIVQWKSVA